MTVKIAKKVALSVVTLAALALSGCATPGGNVSPQSSLWEGKNKTAVIEKWGSPQETKTLSDGSEVWTYTRQQETTIGGELPAKTTRKTRTESYVVNGVTLTRQVDYEETNYEPGRISYCEARFTIKDDVVKSVAFKGDGCA